MRKITDGEIQFFVDNGYLILKNIIQPDELDVIQGESQRLIDEILNQGPADPWCMRGPEGIPYYLTYLHSHPNEFSLKLLGHPTIGDLLYRIIGPDFIPCYESLVFKLPKNGSSVRWHRDGNAIRENLPIFNVDIYIDHSTVENGCVWVIPGSHLWGIEEAQEIIDQGEANFDRSDAVPAEVEPGDILLHHTKVLHGSKINTTDTLRRVIYFDQRTPKWNETYKWWQNDFLTQRCKMYQRALRERSINPYTSDTEQFQYEVPADMPNWEPEDDFDLRIKHGDYPYKE
ncbi:phytanoyl-CoA dioxygenase family protein [Candidatus Poribacteria bacterium]|nr:phytanoyl-CoA dioxygenase family protein [Candidatus Poribacteria bacterium]